MISVVVADDHAVVREGLSALVSSEPDMTVVAAVDCGEAAVAAAEELSPDVVLMDLAMPGIGGVEATGQITSRSALVSVVVLTTFAESSRVLAALDAGAVGYMLKDALGSDLIAGIRSAAAGGSPLDPRVARTLVEARHSAPPARARLTDKQKEVLDLVARGMSNRLIARQLGISEKTVKAHLTTIYSAIGVTDRVQAALWATQGRP